MAGKKKKTLANKLAKMTDEERARYLQQKADVEEEAKRRKEQLIATFMKKKIKKEEAFSRLNQAKINQNWHQILRKAKCKEMKENVVHMKKWIEQVLAYKNKTITKLMDELEEAEEQYLNNLQCHCTHIDNIIENQHQYIETLQSEYENDLEELLVSSHKERETVTTNAEGQEQYLQLVLYGQETVASKTLKKEYEEYMQKCYEADSEFEERLDNLWLSRCRICDEISKQIARVVKEYIRQTDVKRLELGDMRRLDEKEIKERKENEKKMKNYEELLETLRRDFSNLKSDQELKIKFLETEAGFLNNHFLKFKRNLHKDLATDEQKLRLLSDEACNSLRKLKEVVRKGNVLKMLAQACSKFETEREKVSRWLPITQKFLQMNDTDEEVVIESKCEMDELGTSLATPREYMQAFGTSRPKTAFSTKTIHQTPTPELQHVPTVENVTFQAKNAQQISPCGSSSFSKESSDEFPPGGIIQKCFESLKNLENFWFTYNKVEVDYIEISEEKRLLEKENKQLRGMIRAVLEAAALSKSIPSSKVSTRLPSRRSAFSAPLRRIIL